MFSGIVQYTGQIGTLQKRGAEMHLALEVADVPKTATAVPAIGDSVAVNGVCLTVTEVRAGIWCFDLSPETLSRTLFTEYREGRRVNVETALRVGDPIGGHFVSGHVDGVATVLSVAMPDTGAEQSRVLAFRAPRALAGLIAVKGSVAVDGVSLTVNALRDEDDAVVFEVNLVPHTLRATVCAAYDAGTQVHIEADPMARYLARLYSVFGASSNTTP